MPETPWILWSVLLGAIESMWRKGWGKGRRRKNSFSSWPLSWIQEAGWVQLAKVGTISWTPINSQWGHPWYGQQGQSVTQIAALYAWVPGWLVGYLSWNELVHSGQQRAILYMYICAAEEAFPRYLLPPNKQHNRHRDLYPVMPSNPLHTNELHWMILSSLTNLHQKPEVGCLHTVRAVEKVRWIFTDIRIFFYQMVYNGTGTVGYLCTPK